MCAKKSRKDYRALIKCIIVRCVGGSKAPPVLHSSYRTVFERDCAVRRTARRGRPNLRFSKVWRAHRQPGEPQDAFANCFNPLASAKIGRTLAQFLNGTVLYDRRQGEGGRTFAFPRFGELTGNQESHKTLLQTVSTRERARKSAGHSHSF